MNIVNKIWNKSRKIILLLLIVLIAVGATLIYQLIKREEVAPPVSPTPPSTVEKEIVHLEFISVHPKPGNVQLANTRNAITVEFNKDVDVSSVIIQSSPKTNFKVIKHPDISFYGSIIIQPNTPWIEGTTYKIKILKGIKAAYEDLESKDDINIEYKVLPIELPNYDRPA